MVMIIFKDLEYYNDKIFIYNNFYNSFMFYKKYILIGSNNIIFYNIFVYKFKFEYYMFF